jgi:hypothetical protein
MTSGDRSKGLPVEELGEDVDEDDEDVESCIFIIPSSSRGVYVSAAYDVRRSNFTIKRKKRLFTNRTRERFVKTLTVSFEIMTTTRK